MSICQNLINAPHTDFICTLPAGHAGSCDFIDAMGMCGEHSDCRATARQGSHFGACDWTAYRTARENAIQHDPRCPARDAVEVTAWSLTKIAPALYLIPGSSDGDGQPYTVFRSLQRGAWVVQDSRGRVVSTHFTRHDAVKSVEVNA